ncbi:alpha/beta hydrolase [Deferrisoma camini]|uniref:alpha/beta hydrolase n=1 Tax=Deferrisoma camini TaxID=1035120 RepID=UPI00046CC551|nr:alpha/beta fold hydrolase [Deferrisoma camini]
MRERPVRFPGRGVELEGRLFLPAAGRVPGLVLCHPHPLYGGSMDVPVIAALARAAGERGFATLRFNFRGVGDSTGAHGGGDAEVDDVAAAVAFLASRRGVDPDRMALVGYSFGAWVGGRAAAQIPAIQAVVAVAPPLARMALDAWRNIRRPKLIVVGDRDEYCPLDLLESWFQGLPAPKERAVLEGADHFLWGREDEVARRAAGFLAVALQDPGGEG